MSDIPYYEHYEKHASALGKMIQSDYTKESLFIKGCSLVLWGFVIFVGIYFFFSGISSDRVIEGFAVSLGLVFLGIFFLVKPNSYLVTKGLFCCENGILYFQKHDFVGWKRETCFLYKEMKDFNITKIEHQGDAGYVWSSWEITSSTDQTEICYETMLYNSSILRHNDPVSVADSFKDVWDAFRDIFPTSANFINTIYDTFVNAYSNIKIQDFLIRGEFSMGNGVIVQRDGIIFNAHRTIKFDQLRLKVFEENKWGLSDGRTGKIKFLRIGDGVYEKEVSYDISTQIEHALLQQIMKDGKL